jgi:hypothetical protein
MIYFVQCPGASPVKIGYASDFRTRLVTLKRMYRLPTLEPIRLIDDDLRWGELWLHHHFIADHIKGEWFRFNEAMMTVTLPPSPYETFMPSPKRLPIYKRKDITVTHHEAIRRFVMAELTKDN